METTKMKTSTTSDFITYNLRRLDEFFGSKQSKERLKLYKEKILDRKFEDEQIYEAVEKIIYLEKSFPSLATFFEYVPKKQEESERSHKGLTDKEYLQLLDENKRVEIAEKFFEGNEEKLLPYIGWWATQGFGVKFVKNLKGFNLSLSVFKKPALLDLLESGYNFEKLPKIIKKNNDRAEMLRNKRNNVYNSNSRN